MPLRGAWVLVVEDDEDHRRLAADLLMDLGAQVVVAANGSEGLKRLADRCPERLTTRDRSIPGTIPDT